MESTQNPLRNLLKVQVCLGKKKKNYPSHWRITHISQRKKEKNYCEVIFCEYSSFCCCNCYCPSAVESVVQYFIVAVSKIVQTKRVIKYWRWKRQTGEQHKKKIIQFLLTISFGCLKLVVFQCKLQWCSLVINGNRSMRIVLILFRFFGCWCCCVVLCWFVCFYCFTIGCCCIFSYSHCTSLYCSSVISFSLL